MTLAFPERDVSLKRDSLASVGLLADCTLSVAAACLALDDISANDWSSYGGWGSYSDASMRRGWVQHRQRKVAVLALVIYQMFFSATSAPTDVQRPGGGWLNLVVLPDRAGTGSTIEVRGDLDGEMYVSVRSVLRSLFVTVVRVWDPAVP